MTRALCCGQLARLTQNLSLIQGRCCPGAPSHCAATTTYDHAAVFPPTFLDGCFRPCGECTADHSSDAGAVLAYQELPTATEIENAGIVTPPAHLARAELPLKAAA